MGVPEQLRAEQDHIDRAYARIDELRRRAVDQAEESLKLSDTLPSTIADREAALAAHGVRRSRYVIGDQSICFGRIDTTSDEEFHIGRLGVSDAEGEPLLVDWRAPIAESFYRATPSDPRGLTRRRHIRMRGRTVVAIDDEALDRHSLDDDTALVGEAALLAALAAPRRGQMGDIVATIQAQQDEAIRAPLRGVLIVQGGPGTGKTAVALHRAAYLLYAHELELSVQGVLVVGPNKIFARYVENVLPGLGETGVRLATPGELVEGEEATALDPPDVAHAKGAASMVDTLRTTLWSRCRPLVEGEAIGFDRWRLEVLPTDTQRILDDVIARDLPYAQGRVAVFRGLLTHLVTQAEQAAQRSERAGQLSRHRFDAAVVRRRLSDDRSVKALTSRLWPRVTPAQLVDETLAAVGLTRGSAGRSVHDLALLDEATALIGEPPPVTKKTKAVPRIDAILERQLADMGLLPSCPVCGSELSPKGFDWMCTACEGNPRYRSEQVLVPLQVQQLNETIAHVTETFREAPTEHARTTWGHVLVDEAQELTPMQWRMLSRRCPTGSFTIVGDLNQTSGASSTVAWTDVARAINHERPAHVLTLDVNYRTPEEIMRVATEVLRAADSPVDPPRSVRSTGEAPVAVAAGSYADALARARGRAAAEVAARAAGTVVILVPRTEAPIVGPEALDERVVEMGVDQARGLEFDSVIVVEPSRFETHELYVALTRATARLAVVHSEPLPAGLKKVINEISTSAQK
ncbi:MAG TPA: UvrD-helicase domain-containing protein [Acidimicrobiales bacterium]|nr:UvrD-helicase domain-containing protein [Acidimicrobiales bacterium]